jgi:transaldolase
MSNTPVHRLFDLGQSVWLDQLSRELIDSGELASMVERGILSGVTTNPTIFNKAISAGSGYDEPLRRTLAATPDADIEATYEKLVVGDVRDAADALRPVYDRTNGVDGYVSWEVSPHLAYETQATIEAARHLRDMADRPNVLIKVPATEEGLPAITALIAEGISVNVTLMFSQDDYRKVADAYLAGLEGLAARGGDLSQVASVASFFVSRIDVAVDALLPTDSPLRGHIAVANTRMAYRLFQQAFSSERFARLQQQGARVQRFLCASTSTKNPDYRDVLYVEELIGPQTVNTLPLPTLEAFQDHGRVANTIAANMDQAERDLRALPEAGVDLSEVCRQLTKEGVQKFCDSFDALLSTLAERRAAVTACRDA